MAAAAQTSTAGGQRASSNRMSGHKNPNFVPNIGNNTAVRARV
jgi:hypothetical protein